jgi:hypothetical protein
MLLPFIGETACNKLGEDFSLFQIFMKNLMDYLCLNVQLIHYDRIIWWSLDNSSQNFTPLSRFWAVDGCPLLRSSSWSSHPSLYLWNCSKTYETEVYFHKHSQAFCTFLWLLSTSLKRNLVFGCCFMTTKKKWLLHRAAVDAVTELEHLFLH